MVGLIVFTFVRGETTERADIDEEEAKKLLQEDQITVKIVQELLKLNFNPEVLALMHLLFNQLLVVRQLFSHEKVQLQAMPQFPQLEFQRIKASLISSEEKSAFQLDHDILTTEIADSINTAFATNYNGGDQISTGQNEALATVLPDEEVLSPFRIGTVHTLVSEFLGTLMLSQSKVFSVFSEDKVSFSKEYWANILRAYPAENRKYLGNFNALFFILRINLQMMAQVRLMRVETHPKLILIEKRLESISNLLNDPAQRETLDNLIKTLYERVETAVTEGCSGSGDSWPEYDEENDSQEDPRFPRESQQPISPSDILNSTPNNSNCSHHIDITSFKKYLRKCPSQAIELPHELRNLGFHSRQIDQSLSTIQDTLESLETDQLMVKVTEISSFISQDLEEIQRTLDNIQFKYNTSLRFFETFDRSLHNLEVVYTDYHLFILWYLALVILGILLLAKFVSLINFCIHCWPDMTNFYSDFSEYRRVRAQEDDNRGVAGGNQFIELPSIQRRI